MTVLTYAAVFVGGALFLTGASRIFRTDDGSPQVLVQCASGFTLVVAAAFFAIFSL